MIELLSSIRLGLDKANNFPGESAFVPHSEPGARVGIM